MDMPPRKKTNSDATDTQPRGLCTLRVNLCIDYGMLFVVQAGRVLMPLKIAAHSSGSYLDLCDVA